MLMVDIDEKGHGDRDPDDERKRRKDLKRLTTTLLESILIKQVLMIMKNLVE